MSEKSVNEQLLDHAVNHSIDLQRYSNGVVQKMMALLNRADAEIESALYSALSRLPAGSFTVQRLNAVLKGFRDINGKAYENVDSSINSELVDLAEFESEYQADLFEHVIPFKMSITKIDPEVVYAAAMARPFQITKDRAVNLNDYIAGLEADRAAKVRDAIKLGYVSGLTTEQIIRNIRGTKSAAYSDGLMEGSRHHVGGMVRTSISHTSNFTRRRFYDANKSILKGWVFVATLDGKTTPRCRDLDGEIFEIGKGPVLPLHINERSTSAPVTKSWRELGIDMEEFVSTRASMDGQVPQKLTYQTWLEQQSSDRQDDILGSTRGKLFRDGGLTVHNFVDLQGRTLTIAQLKQRNAEVFNKLGL